MLCSRTAHRPRPGVGLLLEVGKEVIAVKQITKVRNKSRNQLILQTQTHDILFRINNKIYPSDIKRSEITDHIQDF